MGWIIERLRDLTDLDMSGEATGEVPTLQADGTFALEAASSTDADAIHDNVTGEIAAVTEKASPVSADLLLIEDSEASNAKKRVQIGNLPGGGGGGSTVPGWMEHLAADGTEDEGQEFTGALGGTLIEPTGTSTWVQDRGLLSAKFHSQASSDVTARMYALSGTWQVGSYVEAAIRTVGPRQDFNIVGVVVADDGGDGLTESDSMVLAEFKQRSTAVPDVQTRRGTFTASAASNSGVQIFGSVMNIGYVRLTMVSSGTWRAEYSSDGLQYADLGGGDLSGGITDVTHYGLGVTRWGAGTREVIASCDFLRVYNLA